MANEITIKCIAVDDEPLALRQLEIYIKRIPYFELVASCKSAIEAGEVLKNKDVDAMFVDINMPDLNGMDFVKSLEQAPLVVFTTAYSEYALEGYKVSAVDYLLKPFGQEEFTVSAEKVKKQYELMHAEASVSETDADDAIFFKTDYKVVRVLVSEIRYVEGMSEYLKIYLEGEKNPVIVLLSMKKLEMRLPANRFMRVHKSYIVNLQKIKEVSKGHILVDGDSTIPVGDLYKETLQSYIDKKFLGK